MQFLNASTCAVTEALESFVQSHPHVQLLGGFPDIKVVVRAPLDKNKVAVVSGGGSGHEPTHAGYVGKGMLDAAVCGEVFASPSVAAVLAAIRHVTGPPGVLLIVKNYTGDRLNFGLAAERAKLEGYKVDLVVVADDCALPPPLGVAGRRGLAGTLFVHKCAGAAAAAGKCLAATALEAREAAAAVGTMGVATAAHTLPGAANPARVILAGEMEMGLGIHGEPGAYTAPTAPVDQTVAQLLEKITDKAHGYMSCLDAGGGEVAVMVNGLGATPLLELHVAARAARHWLQDHGLNPVRMYVGVFMSALNMTGLSITLCKVDQLRLERLDALVGAPAWPPVARTLAVIAPMPPAGTFHADVDAVEVERKRRSACSDLGPFSPQSAAGVAACAAITAVAAALLDAEAVLTDADTKVGDGDCGVTHARGADALREDVAYMPLDGGPAGLLLAVGMTIRRSMGGTSGALYDIFFSAAAAAVKNDGDRLEASTPGVWLKAFDAGNQAMMMYGGAKAGDRTMLDALLPACEAARKALGVDAGDATAAAAAAAVAAEAGAAATCGLVAGAGRSSYVPAEVLKSVPDPGATAAARWIRAVADSLAR